MGLFHPEEILQSLRGYSCDYYDYKLSNYWKGPQEYTKAYNLALVLCTQTLLTCARQGITAITLDQLFFTQGSRQPVHHHFVLEPVAVDTQQNVVLPTTTSFKLCIPRILYAYHQKIATSGELDEIIDSIDLAQHL